MRSARRRSHVATASAAVQAQAAGLPVDGPASILRRPDEITEFGAARLLSDTTRIDVRVADIPNPRPQEQILIGDETFLIEGEPRRDRERLIWTMTLCPA